MSCVFDQCWWCEHFDEENSSCEFGVHPDDCEFLLELEEKEE